MIAVIIMTKESRVKIPRGEVFAMAIILKSAAQKEIKDLAAQRRITVMTEKAVPAKAITQRKGMKARKEGSVPGRSLFSTGINQKIDKPFIMESRRNVTQLT